MWALEVKGSTIWRELTVKVRAERHGGGDISSRVTFQGAKVRKPLLAVSGVTDQRQFCGL